MQAARYTGLGLAFIGAVLVIIGVLFLNTKLFTDRANLALLPIFAGLFVGFSGLLLYYTHRKD
jgi:hypothetical protein